MPGADFRPGIPGRLKLVRNGHIHIGLAPARYAFPEIAVRLRPAARPWWSRNGVTGRCAWLRRRLCRSRFGNAPIPPV